MCELAYVRAGLPYRSTHFIFRKGSPFVEKFNEAINLHYSFIERMYNKYLSPSNRRQCSEAEEAYIEAIAPLGRR